MSKDIKGYYALLEVRYDASARDIKSAYRRLAKTHHPDVITCTDGGLKFRAITEAYAVLSLPDRRASYDSESIYQDETNSRSRPNHAIDPITCHSCGNVTAQPRYIVFNYVVSVLLATYRNPIQGIYCSTCAKKAAWKANIITAFAGWWGFPWGPIYTVGEGVRNAFGGKSDPQNNERMLWHNALAFASRGEMKLAYALAEKVARSTITETAENAENLLKILKSRNVDCEGVSLHDPWKNDKISPIGQFSIIAILPLLLAIMIGTADGSSNRADTSASSSAPSSELPTTAATPQKYAQSEPEVALPTCKRPIQNGERLGGNMPLQKSGHALEIENGAGGNAIVKIRKWPSQKLARSFFVENNNKASIKGLPDGEYSIQYAFGESIAEDCKSFTKIVSAGEFPRIGELKTTHEPVTDGVIISHHSISYTLYSVPSGNVRPQDIDPSTFNAD